MYLNLEHSGTSFIPPNPELNNLPIFISEFNSDGVFIQGRKISSPSGIYFISETKPSGEIILTGYTKKRSTDNPDSDIWSDEEINQNENLFFIAQVDSELNLNWTHFHAIPESLRFSDISIDPFGNIIVAGSYTCKFSLASNFPETQPVGESGHYGNFIANFNPPGELKWIKEFGNEFPNGSLQTTILPSGKIITTQSYYLDYNSSLESTFGGIKGYSINTNGDISTQFDLTHDKYMRTDKIISDKEGNLYLTGFFYAEDNHPHFPVLLEEDTGNRNMYLLKVNPSGNTLDVINNLNIFPNPTRDKISILFENGIINNATLSSINGIKIKDYGIIYSSTSLNLNELPTGTYILRLENNDQTTSLKIIKQ